MRVNDKIIIIALLFVINLGLLSADIYDDCDIYGTCQDVTGGNITKYINETNNYYNVTYDFTYDNVALTNQSNSFNDFSLTDVGKLIMAGLINSEDIIPLLDNIYTIGNSTNWFKELYAKDIYSENINSTNIDSTNLNSKNINSTNLNSDNVNSTNINSTNVDSTNVDSENINASNVTIGGYEVKVKNGSLVIQI